MLVIFVLTLCFQFSFSNARSDITPRSLGDKSICQNLKSCSECLRQEGCEWCPIMLVSPFDGVRFSQCSPKRDYDDGSDSACPVAARESIIVPTVTTIQNDTLGDEGRGRQLQPQRLSLTTGPNTPQTIRVKYRRVEGYPVDLYFIMDLSTSMNKTKNILVNLAGTLAETMGKITSDFRMGFGSFIDKPISPFMSQAQIASNKAYSFQHHMKLSRDASTFASRVKEATTYDNLDTPEAGLEALMQAAVCTEQIGWRSNSHRVIIFSTDSPYHMSGDGKLAGIVVPNDEKCHLIQIQRGKGSEAKFLYSLEQLLDYPSISQISRQISANSISVIFAVPLSVSAVYKAFSSRMIGASVGELSNDSTNIVDLIKEQYSKISSKVKLAHRAPEGVEVTYSSVCQKEGKQMSTNECTQLKPGTEVEFAVTITVRKCRNQREGYKDKVEIFPVGVNEALTINLEVICDCDCDLIPEQSPGLEYCNVTELTKCTMCECDPRYFKPACPMSTTNNEMCGGPGRGECLCRSNGKCSCADGWTGSACDCPVDKSGCKNPDDGNKICSGRGKCNCGKCDCDKTDGGQYTGSYCETNPMRCMEFRDCVRCKAFGTGLSEEECSKCSFNVTLLDEVQEEDEDDQLCSVHDESDCNIIFVYKRTKQDPAVRVRRSKVCREPPNYVAIVSGVSGAILGIGLLLLVAWKILTTVHDRIEYSKFVKERAKSKWHRDENPLYRVPTSMFANPSYSASSENVKM